MQCRKCGAELHHEERVCARCGTPTPKGGGFYVEEERKWRPSAKSIKIAAGVVVGLLIVLIGYNLLHVTPPEVVAQKWFDAMVSRQIGHAQSLTSEACLQDLTTRMMDLRTLSDEYYTEVVNNQAQSKLAAPAYRDPNHADIVITLSYPGGDDARTVTVKMVKEGRHWLVQGVS